MAERKATNKYYPPDWDPSKGSINTFVGQHPLRDRARKISQGILIVRFELPFNIWCTHCNKHVGMGVRYNAEKKKVGMYYTTPILEFRMKCHLCSGWIEIRTDPKNAKYVIMSGARLREEGYDPADIGLPVLADPATAVAKDAFATLETNLDNESQSRATAPSLSLLHNHNKRTWSDPYAMSQLLRKEFRAEKKVRVAKEQDSARVQAKYGLAVDVAFAEPEDERVAQSITFERARPVALREKLGVVRGASVFGRGGSLVLRKGKDKPAAASARDTLLQLKQRERQDPFSVSVPGPSSASSSLSQPQSSHSPTVSSTPSPLKSMGTASVIIRKRAEPVPVPISP